MNDDVNTDEKLRLFLQSLSPSEIDRFKKLARSQFDHAVTPQKVKRLKNEQNRRTRFGNRPFPTR